MRELIEVTARAIYKSQNIIDDDASLSWGNLSDDHLIKVEYRDIAKDTLIAVLEWLRDHAKEI